MADQTQALTDLYGDDPATQSFQQQRYSQLTASFRQHFGDSELCFFSSPGRVELGGNHTDHNHGRVLAASIDLDSIAVAASNKSNAVVIHSEGYPSPFVVDLADLAPKANERETTQALIRGIAARFKELGYAIGGFNACISSTVLPGSGLSSSASIEVLIGAIFNTLDNDNSIAPEALAAIGQFAENQYFGKPCGLMDQLACAVGGIIGIDFKNPANPLIEPVGFNFTATGHSLLIVDTGGSHADLTADYAAVPQEMKAVAGALGGKVLRDIDAETLSQNMSILRNKLGDRAILRAIHFRQENQRVGDQIEALENGDLTTFLNLVKASGNSSFKWLQNVYASRHIEQQGIALALALTEDFLEGCYSGACRIHGGGFAGTILLILPISAVSAYTKRMEAVFGKGCVTRLGFRDFGALNLESL